MIKLSTFIVKMRRKIGHSMNLHILEVLKNLTVKLISVGLIGLILTSCSETAKLANGESFGPRPNLSQMNKKMMPTVNVAKAIGWPADEKPIAAQGTTVVAFASDLVHPRWLYELPNGDILVAESTHIEKNNRFSFKAWIAGLLMKKAGAALESPNRISLLRDGDGDGVAEQKYVFLKDLNSPFGMALIGNNFYVANADAVVKFPYQPNQTTITETGSKVVDLPTGRNHHWTKSLLASKDGKKLYVGVGSNSNIAEHGMAEEKDRAAILEVDLKTNSYSVFASGLRNPVGLTWEPDTGALWVSVNERDELGSDLVPDYMTSVRKGGFYGWPYSYYGQNVDSSKPAIDIIFDTDWFLHTNPAFVNFEQYLPEWEDKDNEVMAFAYFKSCYFGPDVIERNSSILCYDAKEALLLYHSQPEW